MAYFIIGGDGREYGPIGDGEIRDWIREGRLNSQSKIRLENAQDWTMVGQLPEFQPDLSPGAGAQPPSHTPPPQHPYPPPPQYHPAQQSGRPQNSMAVVGLILGIVSFVSWCCCYGVPFNVLGIIFSAVALTQIRDNPNQEGKGMAIAGLVMSILSLLMGAVGLFFGIASAVYQP